MGESFGSAEAARRLSCDAGIVEVVEDGHGASLSVDYGAIVGHLATADGLR